MLRTAVLSGVLSMLALLVALLTAGHAQSDVTPVSLKAEDRAARLQPVGPYFDCSSILAPSSCLAGTLSGGTQYCSRNQTSTPGGKVTDVCRYDCGSGLSSSGACTLTGLQLTKPKVVDCQPISASPKTKACIKLAYRPNPAKENEAGKFTATLKDFDGKPLGQQDVTITTGVVGDAPLTGKTNDQGVYTKEYTYKAANNYTATVTSTANTQYGAANDSEDVIVQIATSIDLEGPSSVYNNQQNTYTATLYKSDGLPLGAGYEITFTFGDNASPTTATKYTDANGVASATVEYSGGDFSRTITATFTGSGPYAGSAGFKRVMVMTKGSS